MELRLWFGAQKETLDALQVHRADPLEMLAHLENGAADDAKAQGGMKLEQFRTIESGFAIGPASQLRECPVFLASPVVFFKSDAPAQPEKMFFDPRVDFRQKGKNLLSKPVSRERRIVVAGILPPTQPVLAEIAQDLSTAETEQRTQIGGCARSHGGQPRHCGAANEAMKDRLGLVSAMMSQGDPAAAVGRRDFFQKCPPHQTSALLEAHAESSGFGSHIDASGGQGEVPPSAEFGDEVRVGGACAAQGMIKVRHMETKWQCAGQHMKDMEQGD